MGDDKTVRIPAKVMRAMCRWLVGEGLIVVEKFITVGDLTTLQSLGFIIDILVGGMIKTAFALMPEDSFNAKVHSVLDVTCRRVAGSIEQHAFKYHVDKQLASKFSAAWKLLSDAKKALADKVRREEKEARCKEQMQVNPPLLAAGVVCKGLVMSIFHVSCCR